jgi:hypothetical protein
LAGFKVKDLFSFFFLCVYDFEFCKFIFCIKAEIMVLNVNGVKHEVSLEPDVELLSVLRNELELTGSKYGCGEGACGAGKEITTIEGLEKNGTLHRFRLLSLRLIPFNVPIVHQA